MRGTHRRPGGVPNDLAIEHPHPGGQEQLPAGPDVMAARYNASKPGPPLRREPTWRARRDRLYGQPLRQQARAAAVQRIWGSDALVWSDILLFHGRYRFIPSFVLFIGFR